MEKRWYHSGAQVMALLLLVYVLIVNTLGLFGLVSGPKVGGTLALAALVAFLLATIASAGEKDDQE